MATASDIANLRTGTASQLAGATTDHANRDIAINDANYARRQGVDSAYIGSAQGAYDDFASRLLGIDQNWLSGLGTARNNRANLMGSAASQYGTNALTGMANLGDARAAGAANWGTAIQNGINTGMSIYGYNQANRGPESYMPSVTGPMARPANLGANANALSGIGSWIGGLFGRAGVA